MNTSFSSQSVLRNLEQAMTSYCRERGLGQVLTLTEVYLPGCEAPLTPALSFVSVERQATIDERGVQGAPDVVVEILAPGESGSHSDARLSMYQAGGVSECWIIDLAARTVEAFFLHQDEYLVLGHWESGDLAHSNALPGFVVAVDEVLQNA